MEGLICLLFLDYILNRQFHMQIVLPLTNNTASLPKTFLFKVVPIGPRLSRLLSNLVRFIRPPHPHLEEALKMYPPNLPT